jgi:hypothetical protein
MDETYKEFQFTDSTICTLDSETIGLHGFMAILQYAFDDGPIVIHELWRVPVRETLDLIELICRCNVLGFNLAFDWFHISKVYTTFTIFAREHGDDAIPEEYINEIGIYEEQARHLDICVKPRSAMDLMLHARKGPYQSLMNRDDIAVKKVPIAMSFALQRELEKRVELDGIYFARNKDKYATRWKIYPIKDKFTEQVDPNFVDIKLKFKASTALKNLVRHALKIKDDDILLYSQIEPDPVYYPEEIGYAPFALAISPDYARTLDWKNAWPSKASYFIAHWQYNEKARKYAGDDVDYTRRLWYFFGCPKFGDRDSVLACMVGAARWRGFDIDKEALKRERAIALVKIATTPQAPHIVQRYLKEVMDPIEQFILKHGTKKTVLEEIATWVNDDGTKHAAAIRASEVLGARKGKKRIELIDKLLLAGRFHASFKIIGTKSSRMAGTDGLNPQGIDKTDEMRGCFTIALDDEEYSGGDFEGQEITIAVKVFDDKDLEAIILSGKKIHGLLGMELYPPMTYEEVRATEGTTDDKYTRAKSGVYLMCYGGDANTFKNKLGIPLEIGEPAFTRFTTKYKGINRFGKKVHEDFGALRQPGGLGTKVEWHEPKEYAESFLGFKRYFTLEFKIAKVLFELAQKPPKEWKAFKIKVRRHDRVQTADGAVQSALYGAAFRITSSVERAAKNHYIQSPGAEITKATQVAVWELQPIGATSWHVRPFNVHDEINVAHKPELRQAVEDKVQSTVRYFQAEVPLLKIAWKQQMKNWAGKH